MTRTEDPSVRTPARSKRWRRFAGVGLLGVLALVAVIFVVSRREEPLPGAQMEDPGVSHVHGLGINPSNGDLYAATHWGLFHITPKGEGTRIADRFQDTMGFTVVGSDHFLASGHPDLREELPPLLGLIESKDAGRTWKALSLQGKADFHVLRYLDERIYGYDSTGGRLMVSRNGRAWTTLSEIRLGDFAVNPKDDEVVVATTARGLERSEDGGRNWDEIESPAQPLLLAWPSESSLWLVDAEGTVFMSTDAGDSWGERGALDAAPEAFLAAEKALYAATEHGIMRSRDEGRTWKVFFTDNQHTDDS